MGNGLGTKRAVFDRPDNVASVGLMVAPLLTLCLVLQWGGARIFSFNPTALEGGTQGTIVSQLLLFLTNAITACVFSLSPQSRALLRRCWPIMVLPGLAIVSSIWSVYPILTFRAGISYALTTLLGFTIAGALPPALALRVVVRALGYCCILSVLVALLLPGLGVHQANDGVQVVHAGYWRGILGHKIGLGIVAGLALPLLILYGRLAFPHIWVAVAACALICLVNASSVTAYGGAILFSILLIAFRFVATGPGPRNTTVVNLIVAVTALFVVAMVFGMLNWVALVFDKSTDLTGRADMWPIISATLSTNGLGQLIGYGYVAGMTNFVGPTVAPFVGMAPSDAHNGYLEVLIAFGYLGGAIVFLVHYWLFQGCRRLPLEAQPQYAKFAAVPISLFFAAALLNYSESLLMSYASLFGQLTPLAAVWMFRLPEKKGVDIAGRLSGRAHRLGATARRRGQRL